MNLFFAFLGVLVLAVLVVGWYLLNRRLSGKPAALFGGKGNSERSGPTELEAFIAAYRAGKVGPEELKSESAAAPATASRQSNTAAPAMATSPPAFLRPEVKLAYLTIRAGLRDHHVFANVRLADLAKDAGDARVDMLVLDAKFLPVAAIDLYRPGEQTQADKLVPLRTVGVRYLRLNATAMPKPGEIHALIYRS
jgi:hypothetical protein